MLTNMSFVADKAASGEEAIAMVRQASETDQRYEIAFIDWQMPGLNGIETGKRILSLPDLELPPHLVMVTAYGREEVLKQAEDSGFENVLIKPVTSSILFDTTVVALGAECEHAESCPPVRPSLSSGCAAHAFSWSRTTRLTRKWRWASSKMPKLSST
jgi:two-component system, sensor histidine kinase and response regulator